MQQSVVVSESIRRDSGLKLRLYGCYSVKVCEHGCDKDQLLIAHLERGVPAATMQILCQGVVMRRLITCATSP